MLQLKKQLKIALEIHIHNKIMHYSPTIWQLNHHGARDAEDF